MSGPLSAEALDRALATCALCPRMCRHACPVGVAARDEALTTQEKMAEARRVFHGEAGAGETVFACTACGLCTATCAHDVPVARVLLAARAEVEEAARPEGARALARRARSTGGPCTAPRDVLAGIPASRRVRGRVRESEAPFVPGRGRRVLLPGCTLLEDDPERVETLLGVADALGEGDLMVYDGPARCCGTPALAAGDRETFRTLATALAEALEGAALVVTPCAHCAYALQVLWPAEGIAWERAPRIVHVTRFLEEGLARGGLHRPLSGAWVLHEPCHLAHGLEEAEAPRRILETLTGQPATPAPPASLWQGARAYCCGGGGALPETSPALAQEMARIRAADLLQESFGVPGRGNERLGDTEAGGDERPRLVCASPCCERSFAAAGIPTEDLIGLVARVVMDPVGLEGDEG